MNKELIQRKILNSTLIILILIASFMLSNYVFKFWHEGLHAQNCRLADGIVTSRSLNHVSCSVDTDYVRREFIWSEIVGYHLIAFIYTLHFLSAAILLIINFMRK